MEITFQPGDLFREFTVNITDDGALEIDEVFSAILQLVSPDPSGRIAINPPTADVTILDDDGKGTNGYTPLRPYNYYHFVRMHCNDCYPLWITLFFFLHAAYIIQRSPLALDQILTL